LESVFSEMVVVEQSELYSQTYNFNNARQIFISLFILVSYYSNSLFHCVFRPCKLLSIDWKL